MTPRRTLLRHGWLYFLADLFAIVAAYYATIWLRFASWYGQHAYDRVNTLFHFDQLPPPGRIDYVDFYIAAAPRILFFLAATLCIIYAAMDFYAGRRLIRRRDTGWNFALASALALLIFYGYFYLSRNQFHPRSMFLTILFLNAIIAPLGRMIADQILHRARARHGLGVCPALLVGENRHADFIRDVIQAEEPHGIRLAGRIGFDPACATESIRAVTERARELGAAMIICAEPSLDAGPIMQLLERARTAGAMTKILSNHLDVLPHKARVSVDTVYGVPLVHFGLSPDPERRVALQKFVSRIAALILLVVLSPILALIALLILATGGRPILFIQERIGVNRVPFQMLKFRTMHNRAEEMQAAMEEFNQSGALFKVKGDPRITRVGRVLRRFSLDELPQLVNVLRGEMVVVGPRPLPRRDFNSYYEEWHYSRHEGMPGLTCLWQVSGRSDLDFNSMCVLDIYYLRNASPMLDMKIILRTVRAILFPRGAY